MSERYDSLEVRDPDAREADLSSALPSLIASAVDQAPGWKSHLDGIDPASVSSREALAGLPLLRKADLVARQELEPPFGGFATSPRTAFGRLFLSPGPIAEPEGTDTDWWRTARALFAAGFRQGDVVHNSFAYHLTPGGFMLDAGARALGCAVVPAGVGNTDGQVDAIARFRPTCFTGVPDYLKALLDRADERGVDASSVKRAFVSGGPLFPSLREVYADRGIGVGQGYATADLGMIAYEVPGTEGMVVDEGAIVEIVRPGTGDPVPDGEVGEVVVTTFTSGYPMIRLATGDLSAVLPGQSPCGRTNMRIRGWMGRADQATKVRGMFVRPEQMAEIARRVPDAGRLRLVVTRSGDADDLTLLAEADDAALADHLESAARDVIKLRAAVEIVTRNSLANDGKVISDERDFGG